MVLPINDCSDVEITLTLHPASIHKLLLKTSHGTKVLWDRSYFLYDILVASYEQKLFPNKWSGIHSCFSPWKCKRHSNLEQRLRLKCKRGSEKSLQESVPRRSRLTEAPLCSFGHTTYCPRICVLWAFMCFLCSSHWFSYTPLYYTRLFYSLKASLLCLAQTRSGGWTSSTKQTNKQRNRAWMECFTELVGVHNCSSGWKNAFSWGNRK